MSRIRIHVSAALHNVSQHILIQIHHWELPPTISHSLWLLCFLQGYTVECHLKGWEGRLLPAALSQRTCMKQHNKMKSLKFYLMNCYICFFSISNDPIFNKLKVYILHTSDCQTAGFTFIFNIERKKKKKQMNRINKPRSRYWSCWIEYAVIFIWCLVLPVESISSHQTNQTSRIHCALCLRREQP